MLWFKKKVAPKKKPAKIKVMHLDAPDNTAYTVDDIDVDDLSDTDLQGLTKCIEQREQVNNGTFVEDTTLFEQTRWDKDRR